MTSAAPLTASAGTVLLVASDASAEARGEGALNALGFDVVLARDGQQALESFQASPARFSLVLLDLDLPDEDGAETRRAMLALRPETRILLSSSEASPVALRRAHLPENGVGFVQKPFRGEDLALRVWEALAG